MAEEQSSKYGVFYSLEGRGIPDIKPYVQILRNMPNLRYLSLKNNKIEEIPTEIQELKTLNEIDLSENIISNVIATLDILKDLPRLKSLHMDIESNMVDKLKSTLPNLEYLNGRELYTLEQTFNHIDWKLIDPSIESAFLMEISNIFELISHLFLDDSGNSSKLFAQTIQSAIQTAADKLSLSRDPGVRAMILVRTRTQLQRYCLYQLLRQRRSSVDLSFKILMQDLLRMQWRQYSQMEKIVFYQLRGKINQEELLMTSQITRLKETIGDLNRKVGELKETVTELEKENSGYLEKLISYSKGNVLSLNGLELNRRLKDANISLNYSSPELQEPKKLMDQSQLEDTISDIYDKKGKHEAASKKKTTMSGFLHTYFMMKLGSNLSQQTESLFIQSLASLSSSGTNHNIILFSKILNNECQEDYLNQVKIVSDNLVKKIKVYIRENPKKIQQINDKKLYYEDIERVLDSKTKSDIKVDIDGLMTLLTELNFSEEQIQYILQSARSQRLREDDERRIREKLNASLNKTKFNFAIPSNRSTLLRMNSQPSEIVEYQFVKMVVNAVLNMNMKKHLEKISEFVKAFKAKDLDNDGEISELEFKEITLAMTDNWIWKDTAVDPKKKVMFHQVFDFIFKKNKKKSKKAET